MLRNYLKTAFRNLARNRSYTIINIAGLAVGIAVCLIIFIVIQFQTSFDTFHSKKDRIYRVLTEFDQSKATNSKYSKDVPFPLPKSLQAAFPQIEQIAPIFASSHDVVIIPNQKGGNQNQFKEQNGVFFTGPSFFNMFDFPLLAGSYTSLKEPNHVLLTKEIAEKYFPEDVVGGAWQNIIGKTIKLEVGGYMFEHGTEVLKVSGILASIPANTDFQLKLVVAYGTGFTSDLMANSTDWEDKTNANFGCFVLLPENVTAQNINQQLKAFSII
jgi:putative ABC transport system permease protein